MSVSLDFDFSTGADYTYDTSKIEVTGGVAKLKLGNDTGKTFTQDFSSSTGFSYNATTTEFSGGVIRQKDTRPANATFGANYGASVNGNWGGGSLTAAGTGTVSGGKLDLTGATKYTQYSAVGNADSAQAGTIRLKRTPNYSGAPAGTRMIFTVYNSSPSLVNVITLYHNSVRNLVLSIYNSAGVAIINNVALGLWSQVQGTEYEFELNYDITTGATRLFIDGVQFGATQTQTGTRGSSLLFNIGADYNSANRDDAYADDVIVFSTVQHTANYTPSWTNIYDTIYVTDTITCPTHTYAGAGAIQAWESSTIDATASPRFILNGFYWSGSAWAASSDTWATASPATDIAANIATLPAADTLVIKIIWDAGAVQMITDTVTITYTGQAYAVDNQTIEGNASWMNEGLDGFTETKTVTGSDNVRYILKKGTDWYYHTGTAWAVSNASYSQANTAGAIEGAKATFTTAQITSKFRAFLHSDDGTTTPEIDNLEIAYNFGGETKDTISRCIVWGYLVDPDLSYSGSVVKAKLNENIVKYKNNITVDCSEEITATINTANGYWEMSLIENVNMPSGTRWKFSIAGETFERHVPNEITKNVYLLTYNP